MVDKIKSNTDGEEDIDAEKYEFCGLERDLVEKEVYMNHRRA